MPLKLALKANEKLIINGAVISAGDQAVTLQFHNKANILRGREILKEEAATNPTRRLYFMIQLCYVFPESDAENRAKFALVLAEARAALPGCDSVLGEIEAQVAAGEHYAALKLCRGLPGMDCGGSHDLL